VRGAQHVSAYNQHMAENSTDELILVEIQDNAREAGQRLRASYNLMRTKGMLNNPNYRQLEIRLTTALSMVEGVYSEARKRSDM
jgi:hypothetical protein